MPARARFFGLDLAWSDHRSSGVCALDADGRVTDERMLETDDEIVDWVAFHARGSAVIGADIPLLVPNETGSRPCDRAVASAYGARGAGPHPANRSLFIERFGRVRGEDLARRFATLGFGGPFEHGDRVLIEVYPHPGIVEAFGLPARLAYKKGSIAARRSGLLELRAHLDTLATARPALSGPRVEIPTGATGRQLKSIEDRLDARFCAWTAASWDHGCAALFGEAGSGHIVVGRRCAANG